MKITRKATTWFWVLLLCLPFLLYGVSVFRSGLIADQTAAESVFAPGSFDPDAVDFVDVKSYSFDEVFFGKADVDVTGWTRSWSDNVFSYTFTNYSNRYLYVICAFRVLESGFYRLNYTVDGYFAPLSITLSTGAYNSLGIPLEQYSAYYLDAGTYNIRIDQLQNSSNSPIPITGTGSITFHSLDLLESTAQYSTGLTSSPGSFQSFFLNNFDFPSFTSWMYKAPQYLFGSLSDGGLSLRESYNIYFVTSLICYLLVVTVVKFLVDILLLVPRIIAHYVNRLGGGDF